MAQIRTFDTGATRDSDVGKHDYEGYLSPLVLERYAEYMTSHRTQADGSVRDSDNWQKGMSLTVYMKSKWRHFVDSWKLHRGYRVYDKKTGQPVVMDESLCAELFNTMGYLHEYLKVNAVYEIKGGDLVPLPCVEMTEQPQKWQSEVGRWPERLVKTAH